MKNVEKIYYIILFATYFIYITSLIGVASFAPEYLETLQTIYNIYIAIILLWRFHPWRKYKFSDFDQQIIFSAAIFMLSSTSLTSITALFRIPEKILEDTS